MNPLSFAQYKEAETTKHIHRLHPYKGKFIPQLVAYFLDNHTDDLKKEVFFKPGEIVLDFFCGSGTTLAVADELGINAIGLELSYFNTLLCNAKIKNYDLNKLQKELEKLIFILENAEKQKNIAEFDKILTQKLSEFNRIYFPTKEFKRQVSLNQINEKVFGAEKEKEFLPIFESLIQQFNIQIETKANGNSFEKWYLKNIQIEILLLKNKIDEAPFDLQDILCIILSRTARSCRATTHSDLATLNEPIVRPYFCFKHGRICKLLFSILKWFKSYAKDTLCRLAEFQKIKTNTFQICLNADATNCDIVEMFNKKIHNLQKFSTNKRLLAFSAPRLMWV